MTSLGQEELRRRLRAVLPGMQVRAGFGLDDDAAQGGAGALFWLEEGARRGLDPARASPFPLAVVRDQDEDDYVVLAVEDFLSLLASLRH